MVQMAVKFRLTAIENGSHYFIANFFGIKGIIVPDHDAVVVDEVLKNLLSVV